MLRALAATLLLSLAAPALAQDANGHGADHGHGDTEMTMPSAVETAASAAFAAANARMHRDMDIDYTGEADIAFVRGMIAHHQGAIDMANVVLQFGDDDEIAQLAREIIAAQTAEIAWMREWLARKGAE